MKPDLALCADSVHILAGDGRNVQANAISDGKPSGLVGTRRDVRDWRGSGSEMIDLGQAVVTPASSMATCTR